MNKKIANNKNSDRTFYSSLLKKCDITLNGKNPWDPQIHNDATFSRVLKDGTLGLGESYMDGWWDCERLDIFFDKALSFKIDHKITPPFRVIMTHLLSRFMNFQSKRRAKQAACHYDVGNKLFKAMLDEHMIYSCGYFKDTKDLDQAQLAKLKLCCEKLKLKPGMRLLDIGCGWGGMAKFAAEHYGVSVVGITLSEEQYNWAQESCKGLDIIIRQQDYRDLNETFDRVVSIGMFEHVGHSNYAQFMKKVHQCLNQQGLFLLHTIGVDITASLADEWIRKYIFPQGMLPSVSQISSAAESFFIMEDLHNFGPYYDDTLMAWHKNFTNHWDEVSNLYDEQFYRMWNYYLLSCAGGFRARAMQLWQVVFSKGGFPEVYQAVR